MYNRYTEKLLYQILSGFIECDISGRLFYIGSAEPFLKLQACNLYDKIYNDCKYIGMSTDEEALDLMIRYKYWTLQENDELSSINLKIDNLKVDMYNKHMAFQSNTVEKLRTSLTKLRHRYTELFNKRHQYDYFTCEGQATLEKMRLIISNTIYINNTEKVNSAILSDWMLSKATELYMLNKPSEVDIRALSNYDGWRCIWSCGKFAQLYNFPAILLTDEQKSLIGWSRLYDNIAEHPDAPNKSITSDDDLLDGWLIVQQSKQNSKQENSGSQAGEIYIPAETREDASRIYNKNSNDVKLVQQQRLRTIKNKGAVNEERMPDSRLKMAEQARNEFFQRMKQSKG
jgi:hypothetical protein